jgi:hypothetical protein
MLKAYKTLIKKIPLTCEGFSQQTSREKTTLEMVSILLVFPKSGLKRRTKK